MHIPLRVHALGKIQRCGVNNWAIYLQLVVVVDAHLANLVLGNGHKLNKALEPHLSDELLSLKGAHTMFSAGTSSEYWALLRKGTAPALNPKHIRYAPLVTHPDLTCRKL